MSQPIVFIIFGATGDLAHRKLIPALFDLFRHSEMTEDVTVIGIGRRNISSDVLSQEYAETLKKRGHPDVWAWREFVKRIVYLQGTFEDAGLYELIKRELSRIDERFTACTPRFFYLATPPDHYATILHFLNASGLARGCSRDSPESTRILIEKPFGKDLKTAQFLDRLLSDIFEEKQIYRIDHYLGKETVQNILALRFANGIFEPTWHSGFIDHVQITLSEDIGIGGRGVFYDHVGALRDIIQNHVFEMLALVAMEEPVSFASEAIRDRRVRILEQLEPIRGKTILTDTVRGQYAGYRQEKDVDAVSETETYTALKLRIHSDRWQGVPFYVRTGKRLANRDTEISIHYKKPPCTADVCFFLPEKVKRNILAIRIQPKEGIALRLMVKQPGFGMDIAPTVMRFDYAQSFAGSYSPDAYERLLLDAIHGDQTLFARTDGIMASWKFVTGVLDGWRKYGMTVHPYAPGTMGPVEADALLAKDGREWFLHKE